MSSIGMGEWFLLALLAILFLDEKGMRTAVQTIKSLRIHWNRARYLLEETLTTMENTSMPASPRQTVRAALRSLSPAEREQQSADLVLQLEASAAFHAPRLVAAFHPSGEEPDIRPWLQKLAAEGRLLLPRVLPGNLMEFVPVHDLDHDLVAGAYGLQEPRKEIPASSRAADIFLVPGMVFGESGERLGHGAGFYDRHLAACPGTPRFGIAFRQQLWPEPLPQQEHDIPMDGVFLPRM